MRIWLCALGMCLAATTVWAREPTGDWNGMAQTPFGELRLGVHIEKAPAGLYQGWIVSPDQGPGQRALADIARAHGALSFKVPAAHSSYTAKWDEEKGAWTGLWTTPGGPIPVDLKPGRPAARPTVAGLDGSWEGAVQVGGTKLRLVIHVFTTPYGTAGTLDSPDQLVNGIPVSGVAREGDTIRFDVKAVGGVFTGALSNDGQAVTGNWTQAGTPLPLNLTRRAAGPKPARARPQTPVKPYPYRDEEVAYDNPLAPGVRLAGTLTLPQGAGPFPAVVLISGSGGQDRDESLLGHKPFLVLADHLTRQGIAVLRFDDRGVARSTGDHATATSADFATDISAGVAYLRSRNEIDPARIGLAGHSEGGLIAPMVAAEDPKIAFTVLMAAPAVRGDSLLISQQRALGKSMGQSDADIDAQEPAMRAVMKAVRDGPTMEAATARARALLAALPKGQRVPAGSEEIIIARLSSNWMRYFLSYDPAPTMARVRSPVLAIGGSKDFQVPTIENLAGIKAAMAANPKLRTVELPGLNHLFQTAPTGAMGEYEDLEETMSPVALNVISNWIIEQTSARSP